MKIIRANITNNRAIAHANYEPFALIALLRPILSYMRRLTCFSNKKLCISETHILDRTSNSSCRQGYTYRLMLLHQCLPGMDRIRIFRYKLKSTLLLHRKSINSFIPNISVSIYFYYKYCSGLQTCAESSHNICSIFNFGKWNRLLCKFYIKLSSQCAGLDLQTKRVPKMDDESKTCFAKVNKRLSPYASHLT